MCAGRGQSHGFHVAAGVFSFLESLEMRTNRLQELVCDLYFFLGSHPLNCRCVQNVAKFEGHTGPVAGMSFSENGYYLATCAADGVKLWDLRKLKNFRTLAPPDGGAATTSVHFDKCASVHLH